MIVEFECEDSADKLVVWRFKMKAFSGPMFPSLQLQPWSENPNDSNLCKSRKYHQSL